MDTSIEREKTCPQCQAVFTCCTENCWCSEMPNVMPMKPTEGCLCPACLTNAIEEKMAKVNTQV